MSYALDSYFSIGYSHVSQGVPCQDYALHNQKNDNYLLVLSDGCSSGRHTDLGARVLVHTINDCFERGNLTFDYVASDTFIQDIFTQLKNNSLLSNVNDQLATLSFVFNEGNKHHIYIYSDGVYSYVKDNQLVVVAIDYVNNMPYYIAYNSSELNELYLTQIKNTSWVKKITTTVYDIENETIISVEDEYLDQTFYNKPLIKSYEDIDQISIYSDGVLQSNLYDAEKTIELIYRLNIAKTTQGSFLKRICINGINKIAKQLQKDFPLEMYPDNIIFIDDFAMATVLRV